MKRLLTLWIAFSMAAQAGDALGDWYATLETPNANFRLALHLIQSGGALSASIDSLDQGAMGIPASAAKLDAGKLLVEFSSIRGQLKPPPMNREPSCRVRGRRAAARFH